MTELAETAPMAAEGTWGITFPPADVIPAVSPTAPYKGKHRFTSPRMNEPGEFTLVDGEWLSLNEVKHMHVTWPSPQGRALYVGEVLPSIKATIFAFAKRYDLLFASMQDYGQRVPIRYGYDNSNQKAVVDGIHRVAIADMLGWENMIVIWTEEGGSHWREWDGSEIGQRYHSFIGGVNELATGPLSGSPAANG